MKKIQKLIKEVLKQLNSYNLIVQAGTELFHGTVEKFNKDEVKPGNYDGLFWTTEHSLISQTYIPVASTISAASEAIAKPSNNPWIQTLQKQIGIDYDYSQVEFQGHQAKGYKIAPVFRELYDKQDAVYKNYKIIKSQYDKLHDDYQNSNFLNPNEKKKALKTLLDLQKKVEDIKSSYYNYSTNKEVNDYVNKKLTELGYKPEREGYENNHWWKLKYNDNKIQQGDYRSPGRLLIVVPKRDLKIYDTTLGGEREGDLTDVDYHKHDWFKKAKEAGYDGIRINDYAQSNDMGNFGHTAIGLFQHVLKDTEIHEVNAHHHDLEDYYKKDKPDWNSPEYIKFKSQLREVLRKSILKESYFFNVSIKKELAKAAQKVYDEWNQNEEGYDEMLGEGGICQDVAYAMCNVLSNYNINCVTYSQEIGEQHVFVIAKLKDGIYSIDIPPGLYETGGGYNWKKIPDVEFDERYIHISRLSAEPDDENYTDLFSESLNKNIILENLDGFYIPDILKRVLEKSKKLKNPQFYVKSKDGGVYFKTTWSEIINKLKDFKKYEYDNATIDKIFKDYDVYGTKKPKSIQSLLYKDYNHPTEVPIEVFQWIKTHGSLLTDNATDAVRWSRIINSKNEARYPNEKITIYRAVDSKNYNEIRPGDWVTTKESYANQHNYRYLNNGKVISMEVNGRDVLVSPTGDSEEAIYAPLKYSIDLKI